MKGIILFSHSSTCFFPVFKGKLQLSAIFKSFQYLVVILKGFRKGLKEWGDTLKWGFGYSILWNYFLNSKINLHNKYLENTYIVLVIMYMEIH